MTAPKVPIDVDPETGIWTSDGLPMLYMPRHFFINSHQAAEEALGQEAYADIVYAAGFRSAFEWCAGASGELGAAGMDVFHHYLRRLSERGWGLFDGAGIDAATGTGEVVVRHSCFVEHFGDGAERPICYLFTGWFPGALAWVAETQGRDWRPAAHEVQCGAQGFDHCIFEVTDT